MQGLKRRVIQAISYEIILLSLFIPIVTLVFKQAIMDSAALGMSLTILALLWNMFFNYGFEKWEARKGWYTRGLKQRLLHALGFESGLLVLGVPAIAYFLEITPSTHITFICLPSALQALINWAAFALLTIYSMQIVVSGIECHEPCWLIR